MGYTTYFEGEVTIDPPLNAAEMAYLNRFANSRRMQTSGGPYHADPGDNAGQNPVGVTVVSYSEPPEGQPGLWCQWVPTEDGTALVWDEGEKFYNSAEWMAYLIGHFLAPDGDAHGVAGFEDFTFDHNLNGVIYAEGEDGERWCLEVIDNQVYARDATPTKYGNRTPVGAGEVTLPAPGPDSIRIELDHYDRTIEQWEGSVWIGAETIPSLHYQGNSVIAILTDAAHDLEQAPEDAIENGAALDELAAYLRDNEQWNGGDFCELAATVIARTGRLL